MPIWCGPIVVIVSCVPVKGGFAPVTEDGLKLHVASAGSPVHDEEEKLTVPLKPDCPLTMMKRLPEVPGAPIVRPLGGFAVMPKSVPDTVIKTFVEN